MGNTDQLDFLMNWLNLFDSNLLKNEDDVETKFILPLFRCLGYSDEYRRGKYPIYDYQPGKGKRGRKPEIDQIYFLVSDSAKQSSDTSLLLVEAKEPEELNLEEATNQAKYYGNHLTPLFLVVTNGHRLMILKRHHYRGEELVFDISTSELLDRKVAMEIYNQLHFDFVKQLKEQGVDMLAHALYTELINISQRYPDLQAQLAKGDFEPSITQEKRRLMVIKPTVAITCDLPITFDEGSCSIEFSSIMLRGLTCNLSHLEILRDLLRRGLETDPYWNTRPFLQKTKQGTFKANVGQMTVNLSEREVYELCEAVDVVGQRYRDIIIDAANNLETWDFLPTTVDNEKGFEIVSVKQWLWDLMRAFSYEFDYDHGTTEWHIFESGGSMIRVSHKKEPDHVIIWPKGGDFSLPESTLKLIYIDSITYLYRYDDKYNSAKPFFEEIGPLGIWSAKYTKNWLVRQFIPQVLSHYLGSRTALPKRLLKHLPSNILALMKQGMESTSEQLKAIMRNAISDYSVERVHLADITEPKHFVYYIDLVQSLFNVYRENIPASILRPYYKAFTELARCADPTSIKHLDYIQGKLSGVQRKERRRIVSRQDLATYVDVLKCLNQQVIRIYDVDYEYSCNADLLSRVFGTIVEDGVFHYDQKQLNAAKKALIPLWEYCRFEKEFIDPIIFEY